MFYFHTWSALGEKEEKSQRFKCSLKDLRIKGNEIKRSSGLIFLCYPFNLKICFQMHGEWNFNLNVTFKLTSVNSTLDKETVVSLSSLEYSLQCSPCGKEINQWKNLRKLYKSRSSLIDQSITTAHVRRTATSISLYFRNQTQLSYLTADFHAL